MQTTSPHSGRGERAGQLPVKNVTQESSAAETTEIDAPVWLVHATSLARRALPLVCSHASFDSLLAGCKDSQPAVNFSPDVNLGEETRVLRQC